MKIAVIAPSQVPSTTANSIQVMKVCQAYAQLHHDVRLWLPGEEATPWENLSQIYGVTSPFDIRWLPSPLVWKRYDLAWKALKQASDWGADCIYTWMLQTTALSLFRKIPVILEMHMLPSGHIGPMLFSYIAKHTGKKKILFITHALQERLEQVYQMSFSPEDSMIAPMGSEPEKFSELPQTPSDARRSLELADALTVAYSGHFYPGRGIVMLFDLAKSLPHIQFLWIGGRQQDIEYWKSRLEISGLNNVLMTGFINNQELPRYLAASDILLMPYGTQVSISSQGNTADVCSPMKMFDYLAAGRAIISSDLPVLHEVLNENNAIFCPPEDFSAWFEAITRLTQSQDMRQKLAGQAKKDAYQYTWYSRAERSIKNIL